jgi:hypothetical protein
VASAPHSTTRMSRAPGSRVGKRGERASQAHRGGRVARADDDRALTAAKEITGGRAEEGPLKSASFRCTHYDEAGFVAPGGGREGGTWGTADQPKSGRIGSREPCRARHPVKSFVTGGAVIHGPARDGCRDPGWTAQGEWSERMRWHDVNEDQRQVEPFGKGAGDRDARRVVVIPHAADNARVVPLRRGRGWAGDDHDGRGRRPVRPQSDRSNCQRGLDTGTRPRKIDRTKAQAGRQVASDGGCRSVPPGIGDHVAHRITGTGWRTSPTVAMGGAPHPQGSTRPWRIAQRVSWTRSRMPSFARMFSRWRSTVLGLMFSSCAI